MKYRKFHSSFLSACFLSAVVMTGSAAAQQPGKIKRPVKNPPQFPNIIDLENKDAKQTERQADQQDNAPVADAGGQTDSLAVAVQSLANELRVLGQELRSLNIRGQAQFEMLRITRNDMRIDYYERELRPVRDRITALESDEQLLRQLMTREGLLAQTASMPTLNREESMKQLRMQHEVRFRAIQSEQERLRKLEADLTASLKIYQSISREAEQKIQEAEDTLKNIESGRKQ
ncbi:MAG TPA: hypothetical protein VJZ77_01595 [Blastocatellia bacterium]|nr:hypothetical protein [Blastocatellia bacterium]